MAYKDLKEFLERLKKTGELIEVKEELDPRHEVAAVLTELGQRESPAAIFTGVTGYNMPVVGNLLGSKNRLAIMLETTPENIYNEYVKRKAQGIPPEMVSDAPVKDVVITENIDLGKTLPILTYHEDDVAPFITQGLIFMKDPSSDAVTVGVHRMQLKGPNRLCIQLLSRTSTEFYRRAEEKNEPLEVAIAIGVDPTLLLSAVTWFPFGDKLGLAGGLRGAPLQLTKGETIGLNIPANAMIVLEGKILPFERETDGPFGESSGYYTSIPSPVVEISAICHQKEPIYAVFKPWSVEEDCILDLSWSGEAFNKLKSEIPSLTAMKLSWNAATAFISLKKQTEGDARRAIHLALMHNLYLKTAIVVDDDVDIYNQREVDWAVATRFQPHKDLVIIDHVESSVLDPSVGESGIGSKIGFDATKPLDDESFKKIVPPLHAQNKAQEILKKYKL